MLVVLAAVVVLAGAWFTVLRPKTDDGASSSPAPAAQAPGVKGLTKAVDKAKGAVSQSQAAATKVEKAAGNETASKTSSSPAAAKPASTPATAKANAAGPALKASAGDPSAPLLAKLGNGKTVVLLFWNAKGADDRAVRDAVRSMGKDKKLTTAVVPISKVAEYQAITTGVQVLTAPTVLVIGKDGKAKTISGLTDAAELRQLVGDVRAGR
jgi:hypothetical protein